MESCIRKLRDLRVRISRIDREIVQLLFARFLLVGEVAGGLRSAN